MQTLERLTASDLAAAVAAFRDALRAHQERINRLNVYPVPDGDTGTNLALTLEAVVTQLAANDHTDRPGTEVPDTEMPDTEMPNTEMPNTEMPNTEMPNTEMPNTEMAAVAEAISYGSLMGARGNSGVILSQILRGLADAVRPTAGIDAVVLRDGLVRAADGAYLAVQHPVEGTILTVARAAANAACALPATAGLVPVLEAARQGAGEALARTPELLPVLKAAGVVDAGGAGLLLLFDALLHVVDGRPLPDCAGPSPAEHPAFPPGSAAGVAGLRYEVMYLLEAPDESIPPFREVWGGLGDSIVVVGGEGLWNCHIHTDDIGAAVEAGVEAGRPRQIRVSDLWEQVEEERWVRDAAFGQPGAEAPARPVRCAAVAVCTGEGIRRIFWSLGVHHVVSGGQSMNPSTEELLAAIYAAPGEQVVLLPNNNNIVPVAHQAAALSEKPVRVIPTRGIQEGFAALLEYDPEGDADANASLMSESAARVVAGEVTRAVRPSVCAAGPIAEGDYLGLSRGGIEVVAAGLAEAATGLLERLLAEDEHEIVTVIVGEGAGAADTRRITEWLAERHPRVNAEVHQGGQPLYPYLFSLE